jgi:hypothetical protein
MRAVKMISWTISNSILFFAWINSRPSDRPALAIWGLKRNSTTHPIITKSITKSDYTHGKPHFKIKASLLSFPFWYVSQTTSSDSIHAIEYTHAVVNHE